MRLLWALLVLLPLVAELAYAQKCNGAPDAPEHATIRCFKKRNTCRAMCADGYQFAGKAAKSAIYTCVGGQWEMKDGHEDRCSPVCEQGCVNGECREPNTCVCDVGYTGADCTEEEYDEDYATEEPAYDNDAYGYDDNQDYPDEEEEEELEYDEDEEAEPAAEPEHEDEPEDEYEGEEDEEDEGVDLVDADVNQAEPEDEDPEAEPENEDEEDQGADDEETVDETVDDDDDEEEAAADDTADDDDDDEEDNDPQTGASTSGKDVLQVVPQILVGSAALLLVRGW